MNFTTWFIIEMGLLISVYGSARAGDENSIVNLAVAVLFLIAAPRGKGKDEG
jgi:hypothetical protein